MFEVRRDGEEKNCRTSFRGSLFFKKVKNFFRRFNCTYKISLVIVSKIVWKVRGETNESCVYDRRIYGKVNLLSEACTGEYQEYDINLSPRWRSIHVGWTYYAKGFHLVAVTWLSRGPSWKWTKVKASPQRDLARVMKFEEFDSVRNAEIPCKKLPVSKSPISTRKTDLYIESYSIISSSFDDNRNS